MRRFSVLTISFVMFLVVMPAWAQFDENEKQDDQRETVGLSDISSPSLLYLSEAPGRYYEAVVLDTDVEITVRGLVAETEVVQRFSNRGSEWLEGVYVFPLPNRAAVHSMKLVIGDRIIEGQIREKEEAKKVYEKAKKEGKKASLVEQERPNIFTTSVANIGPGDEVEVRIEYQQTLEFDNDELELRFPMVVGTRYIPGSKTRVDSSEPGTGWAYDTDQVKDASRITPPIAKTGGHNPVHLVVMLEPGFPLTHLGSAYHTVTMTEPRSGVHRIEIDETPADRDFVLRWAPERGREPRAAVFTEEVDGEIYVLAMVMPPADEYAGEVRLAREIIFVVDTSGSMGGASIRQAREALVLALAQLHPEDYFNIIEFDNNFTSLFSSSEPAMPAAVSRAEKWVRSLKADGGTEMMGPLTLALEDDVELTSLRQIVFITDGCVGNEEALFEKIQTKLGRSRLFTVGIGSAPNSHFMERAALFGRGSFTYIGSPAEVNPKMRQLFTKIENPVLADIMLQWPDANAEAWPQRIPDLYAGEPVVVTARMGTVHGDLIVSGLRSDRRWRVEAPLEIGAERAGINRLWARSKIGALMDQKAQGRPEAEIRTKVIEVALAHHLVSRYTSLVAVDMTPVRPADAKLDTTALKTNLPAGWQQNTVAGNLPRGGTSGRLMILLGCIILILGALVFRRISS